MDWEAIAFDSSALVAGLFLLQYGADSFIENSALILEQVGISPTLAHLVTAGAEWEELAIVVASILQKRTPIGLGNVIGSSISNILGGLAVAMLLYPGKMTFDSCAKFYSGASFISSSIFLLIHYTGGMDFTGGLFYLVFFAVYIFAVGLAIYEGYLTMPVTDEDPFSSEGDATIPKLVIPDQSQIAIDNDPAMDPELQISLLPSLEIRPSICTPLLGPSLTPNHASLSPLVRPSLMPIPTLSPRPTLGRGMTQTMGPIRARTFRSLRTVHSTNSRTQGASFRTVGYHTIRMILGFAAVALSGFVLSYASASLAESFHLSGAVFGLTILSIFSTLPEKFISIIAGLEGDSSLLVASIAGSNVFLLTLCLGILLVAGGEGDADAILATNLLPFEVWCTWGCAVILLVIVWVGGRWWMGATLFMLYISFNVLELTVYRR